MTSPNNNRTFALSLAATALGMLMLAYASVPLYRLFCNATGFGGIAQPTTVSAPIPVISRPVTVRFDANVSPELSWNFAPLQNSVTVHIGEKKHIEYSATNTGQAASVGTATFNISPVKAGKYFHKIQCFCFSEQPLSPQENKHLGVDFYIDPEMVKDQDLDEVDTITLSYTFFPLKK